jgi:hypothetical protein
MIMNWGKKRQDSIQVEVQANLQMCDDTWERLLCALERFEHVVEYKHGYDIPRAVATRLDRHEDKGNIQESQIEVETEVQLQIQAFKYIVKTVKSETETWLLQDFICWLAGRECRTMGRDPLPLSIVDEYAIPVLQCILGERFTLPKIPDASTPPTQEDILDVIPKIGEGQIKTDNIEKRFQDDPNQQATRHRHERGDFQNGMERLKTMAESVKEENWFKRFVKEKRWQSR